MSIFSVSPYVARLICLSLASFFAVHFTLSALSIFSAHSMARVAARLTPRAAARLMLALRLGPPISGMFAVVALCVPSYLWFEPQAAEEQIGWVCLAAALLGAAVWTISIAQSVRAAFRSARYLERCERAGRSINLGKEASPALVIGGAGQLVALVGLRRPRIVVSQNVVEALPDDQLTVALLHEGAHRRSHDNTKRLAMVLAPGFLPFFRGFDPIEKYWGRFTEWAADDSAVAGDPRRPVSLASALVRLARIKPLPAPPRLATSLLADRDDLAVRVNRLLRTSLPEPGFSTSRLRLAASATLLLAAGLVVVLAQPGTLASVHRLLERLID